MQIVCRDSEGIWCAAAIPGVFLGLETNFGDYTGGFPVIGSLATLAHDPRRSEFFTEELIHALNILQSGHIEQSKMLGSWAGAMGQTQFMPSTFTRYAKDGDSDKKWISGTVFLML